MKDIVRTFSRVFPAYHPRAGEPTYFVEKIWKSIKEDSVKHLDVPDISLHTFFHCEPKHHTIRAGHHFKPGDFLVPRVWSGKPYASKQIQFAPPIEIVKTWDFDIEPLAGDYLLNGHPIKLDQLKVIALNDGLEVDDFECWFKLKKGKGFIGQIICWNKDVEYTISKPIALTSI